MQSKYYVLWPQSVPFVKKSQKVNIITSRVGGRAGPVWPPPNERQIFWLTKPNPLELVHGMNVVP